MASPADNTQPPKEEASIPQRCSAGCGFFGSAATGGMCSKCWKDQMAKVAASTAPAPSPAAAAPTPPVAAAAKPPSPPPAAPAAPAGAAPVAPEPAAVDVSEPVAPVAAAAATPPPAPAPTAEPAASSSSPAAVCGAVRASEDTPPEDEPPRKVQVNTSRCWTCNRKIGLLGFQCKCEYYFCAEHRYSDKHECAFDFKAQGKQQLTKANPTIAPAKLEKC